MALNQNKYYPCPPVKLRRPHNLSLPVSLFLSPSFALCESHAFLMNFALAFSAIRPSKIRTGIIGWLLDKCQPSFHRARATMRLGWALEGGWTLAQVLILGLVNSRQYVQFGWRRRSWATSLLSHYPARLVANGKINLFFNFNCNIV